ncbi:MAG: ABC transporter substrate-binding protein [Dehalococcoidia bacterium]
MAQIYDRFMRQRLSRRRLLAASGGTALGAAVIAACGDSGGDGGTKGTATDEPRAEGTPRPGGILKLRDASAYPNMSPFGPGIAALAAGLFDGFTFYDHLWYVPTDTGEVIKFLAAEIEQRSAREVGVTMGHAVYHNKPPVNGRAVKSTDLKASMERFRQEVPLGFSWLHEIFESLDTPDDNTMTYHQNRPWSWFFTSSNAGSPWTSSILPEEILDNDEILQNDPIGSGRWMYDGSDNFSNVRLRKFPNWREKGLPLLDGVDYTTIPDDTLAQAAFEAKNLDSLTGFTSRELDDVVSRLGDDIITSSDLSRAYRTMMVKYEEPFLDERVRHGINLAINREEIMQIIDLGDGQLSGPVPPAHTTFVLDENDPDLQEYFRFDPQEARQMLDGANFPFDQEIELKYHTLPGNPDLAQLLAEQLREVGLKIKLTGEDLTRWLANTLGPGNFQMTAFTHLPYEDPSLPLSFYREPNFMGYKNDDVEAAFQAAAQELDPDRRIELTKEAQSVILRAWAPQYTLYSAISYNARWSYYKGVVEGRGSFGLFNSRAWLDK